jgi:hypothetical protein
MSAAASAEFAGAWKTFNQWYSGGQNRSPGFGVRAASDAESMASGGAPRSYNRNRFPLRVPETGLGASVNCPAAATRAITPSLLRDRVMVAARTRTGHRRSGPECGFAGLRRNQREPETHRIRSGRLSRPDLYLRHSYTCDRPPVHRLVHRRGLDACATGPQEREWTAGHFQRGVKDTASGTGLSSR